MFPGKKAGTAYSFADPKGMTIKEHEVSRPPMMTKYKDCTMAEYSNIEHGEILGESPGPIKHIKHVR